MHVKREVKHIPTILQFSWFDFKETTLVCYALYLRPLVKRCGKLHDTGRANDVEEHSETLASYLHAATFAHYSFLSL